MKSFVERFGTSPKRLEIIAGLLDYRAVLMSVGFTGFQWLCGSFVENVESIRGRPPKDIDVVSIINRPQNFASDDKWTEFIDSEHGALLDSQAMKDSFHCDAWVIDMHDPAVDVVNQTRFWFGLFSHQRETTAWKGMVIVKLDPQEDAEARKFLHPLLATIASA